MSLIKETRTMNWPELTERQKSLDLVFTMSLCFREGLQKSANLHSCPEAHLCQKLCQGAAVFLCWLEDTRTRSSFPESYHHLLIIQAC